MVIAVTLRMLADCHARWLGKQTGDVAPRHWLEAKSSRQARVISTLF